jgi:hypothetical protein
MPTTNELQAEVSWMREVLRRAGLLPREKPDHDPDFIAHGSPQHATMLGLVEVTDLEQAKKDAYTLYTSPRTGKVYRLEDEIRALQYIPGVDPHQAMLVVLRQKVNGLESGPPQVPANAPAMFNPGAYTG